MEDNQSSNKRIAKNTIMLYVRMLLSIVVSLYTSRVVLQTLGVEDYGIYGVVGGVVAMFSFLNAAMSGATSRFLTFEMGKAKVNDNQNSAQLTLTSQPSELTPLQKTFSSAMIIHVGIALTVFLLAITIGLWFLNNKLVIPNGRMTAAYWVYVCSILGMFVSVTQVPYNAAIIAHEKMDVYAYVELLHVFLKLGVVYMLCIGNFDKLILYAFLMLAVSIIVAMTYRIYCLRHYEETHFHWIIDKTTLKSIMSFSIYNLLGNMGSVVNTQGTAFVINMFFGVVLNASASIATTISGTVTGFASNIMVAFRPPITKAYAQEDIQQFQTLLFWAIKAILLVYAFIALPVGFAVQELLFLWLVEVPDYADVFCQLLLISIYFEILRYVIIIGIHAIGRVKLVSLSTGITFCVNPFIIYILFKYDCTPEYAYVSIIGINSFLATLDMFILKYNEHRISLRHLVLTTINVVAVVFIVALFLYWGSRFKTGYAFIDIVYIGTMSSILMVVGGYYGVLDKSQRQRILSLVKNKLKK